MSQEERTKLVSACKWADEVIDGVIYNPTIELLDKHKCEFLVHGDDLALGAEGDCNSIIRNAGRLKLKFSS